MSSEENTTASVFISDTGARIVASFVVVISTVFVAGRFYIRYTTKRLWHTEDYLAIAAWAFNVTACMGYLAILEPFGRLIAVSRGEIPVYDTVADDANYVPKVLFPTNLLFWTTLWTVKLFLLLQIKKLIERRDELIKIWWCMAVFTGLVYVGCVISQFMACSTLKAWFTTGACVSDRDVFASFVSTVWAFCADMSTDIMIAVFPMPTLWHLKMTQKRKLGIIAIFSVGFLSAIASIVRFTAVMVTNGTAQPSVVWQAVWGMIEMAISIIVLCLPALGFLIASQSSAARSYELNNHPAGSRSNATDPYSAKKSNSRAREMTLDNDSEEALNQKNYTSTIQAGSGPFDNRSMKSEDQTNRSGHSVNNVAGIIVSQEVHMQRSAS